MTERHPHLVLVHTPTNSVVLVGTPLGKPFSNEAAAERAVRRLEKTCSPNLRFLALPLHTIDDLEKGAH